MIADAYTTASLPILEPTGQPATTHQTVDEAMTDGERTNRRLTPDDARQEGRRIS